MQKTAASKLWPLIFAAVFLLPIFAQAAVIYSQTDGTVLYSGSVVDSTGTFTNTVPITITNLEYMCAGNCVSFFFGASTGGAGQADYQTIAGTTPVLVSTSTSIVLPPDTWHLQIDTSGGTIYTNGDSAGALYLVAQTGQAIDFTDIYIPALYSTSSAAIAASSSLWSAYASSSALAASCDSGNIFSDGICEAFSFIFVPNPNVLNQFVALPTLASTKFPFSWIYGVQAEVATLSASSTSNMIGLQLNLGSLGIGSTTSMGNILPNFEAFGTSTIETYVSPTEWQYFQDWIAFALWLGLIADVFFLAKRLAQPH